MSTLKTKVNKIDLILFTVYLKSYLSVCDFVCLFFFRQILNMLTLHQKDLRVVMVGLRALALLLRSGMLTLSCLDY